MFDAHSLYDLPHGVVTRWASMENPDGAPGAGGGRPHTRKGSACRPLAAGERFVMAHAEGVGVVRRIWVTISERTPELLRGIVIRAWWDGADEPAIEAPLADLFCQPLGLCVPFENAWFDNPEGRSFNMRIPMPFRSGFRMEAENQTGVDLAMFFYDVNFTLGDPLPDTAGYLHAHWRRENPTVLRQDFMILPTVHGRGRFLGCCLGVNADTATYGRSWWGEGEVKIYLDGDSELPTLVGTGTEDYIATGWGQGQYAHHWHGCHYADHDAMRYGFYRLHGPDPVWFDSACRVTIQQIGCPDRDDLMKHLRASGVPGFLWAGDSDRMMTLDGLERGEPLSIFERTDDWSACAWFYLDRPTNGLPPLAPLEQRTV